MTELAVTISKQPAVSPAEDYYRLRRDGIGFIEKLGSRLWTDYNTHDPGITILEALCYAITDLAYRMDWPIQDLLTPALPGTTSSQPFFTARNILTVNPWTALDFRRLLIDLKPVRNAWAFCKTCACELHYFSWCDKEQLFLSYQKPADPLLQVLQVKKVEPLGLYEVLLELESDPDLGDLNNRKLEHTYSRIGADGNLQPVEIELRFPEWSLDQWHEWKLLLESQDAFDGKNGESFNLTVTGFGDHKDYDLLSDAVLDDTGRNKYLRDRWRKVFYVTLDIELLPGGEHIIIKNAALRLYSGTVAKNETTVAELRAVLEDRSPNGFIQRYRNKLLKAKAAIDTAKASLQDHRNLDEDYCHIRCVDVEDIAVCADIEVKPDADIENVQAKIWFTIEQYLNPPVQFYSLQEMIDSGTAVEEVFNGPELTNGFLKTGELEAASLKTVLRVSDIINLLMDIDGVVAVNNLLLTGYDDEGNPVPGVSDPTWNNGTPIFDSSKISASWLLFVSELHQPRLYFNQSRFLFIKNGLPFLPRKDEAFDTLTQLHGEAERPKFNDTTNDLPIPGGTFRSPEDYFPLQYSFPLTYGIGPNQLPSEATKLRRARASQLKAYLMIYEQMLGNALAQLAHTSDLFSLDPTIEHTYFIHKFNEAMIQGYDQVTTIPSDSELQAISESDQEFLERRNRFLDHILARFGEEFREYALLLTNLQGQHVALERLIDDKISFLKAYPLISHNRGKAFNYKQSPCSPNNFAGLKKRVSLLLGFPNLALFPTHAEFVQGKWRVTFELRDQNDKVWLEGMASLNATSNKEAEEKGIRELLRQMVRTDAYKVTAEGNKFRLKVSDLGGNPLAQSKELFDTTLQAQAVAEELAKWSSNERAIVVEHLLLRPKFPGDALYPACSDGPCNTCGDEDPYSFRLTFVMPGWSEPFNHNLDMRGFADRTIRRETPSHLVGKICWVGNEEFLEDPCDPAIGKLADLIVTKGLTGAGTRPTFENACRCATKIYSAFADVFNKWYEPKILDYLDPDALDAALKAEFDSKLKPTDISCEDLPLSALWPEIRALMLQRFHEIALDGWQFERFEAAWCKWLDANAAIDWSEERLQQSVEAILLRGANKKDDSCRCAAAILTKYGMAYYNWLDSNIKAGNSLDNFTAFNAGPIAVCDGVTMDNATADAILTFLNERYKTYTEVSYRLWIVVNLLSKLTNIYPPATLHDCDDGSDHNPVQLGKTALGS